MLAQPITAPTVKPLTPLPAPTGNKQPIKPNIPTPNTQMTQSSWKPSAVAGIAAQNGNNPQAAVMNMFNQQNKPNTPGFLNKQGSLSLMISLGKQAAGPGITSATTSTVMPAVPDDPLKNYVPDAPDNISKLVRTSQRPVAKYQDSSKDWEQPGQNYSNELAFDKFYRDMAGSNILPGIAFERYLHGGGPDSPRGALFRGLGQKLNIRGNDPDANKMLDEATNNKRLPIFWHDNMAGAYRLPATGSDKAIAGINLPQNGMQMQGANSTMMPSGLIGQHELQHYRQQPHYSKLNSTGFMSFSGPEQDVQHAEITPSLADIPRAVEWYDRKKQMDPTLPNLTKATDGPFSITMPPASGGQSWDARWMHDQAKEHGFFNGKSMAELLNTPSGRAWTQINALSPNDRPTTHANSALKNTAIPQLPKNNIRDQGMAWPPKPPVTLPKAPTTPPIKQGSFDLMTDLGKRAALAYLAQEKLPDDWNGKLTDSSKENGAIPSYGLDAFRTCNKYTRRNYNSLTDRWK